MNIQDLKNNLAKAEQLKVNSNEMHNFINSLSQEAYATFATAYNIGRKGWDVGVLKDDEKELTKEHKKKELDLTYAYEFDSAQKVDGIYLNNWLSQKSNLFSATQKGIELIENM